MTPQQAAALTDEEIRVIYNSRGLKVLIDDEDAHLIEGWSVYPSKNRNVQYAHLIRWDRKKKRQVKKLLHRVIMNAPDGLMVCHLNGNGLDCRKSNLRLGDAKKNGSSYRTKRNRAASGFRGVHRNNGRGKKWTVMFWDNGKSVYLGRYDSEEEAARTYDREAIKRFGEFAHLNFPDEHATARQRCEALLVTMGGKE